MVELGLVEQRYAAVLEVLDGVPVTEAAANAGVTRQTVHRWLKDYAAHGLAGLVDRSKAPGSCPHQMSPAVEGADRGAAGGASRVGAEDDRTLGSPRKASSRCRGGRRSIALWSVTA